MHGYDCNIGCLTGTVSRIEQCLCGTVSRIGQGLCGSVTRVGQGLCGSAKPDGQGLCGSVTLVCSVNKDAYIRFKEGFITWYGTDNNDGVIKYNTLIASGDWSLEEVEIEELL